MTAITASIRMTLLNLPVGAIIIASAGIIAGLFLVGWAFWNEE